MNGVYVLTIYASSTSTANGPMFLRNNDDILCQTWITETSNLQPTGTCTAVVELVVGDSVRVTGNSDDPAVINGGTSGFAGFIISWNIIIYSCTIKTNNLKKNQLEFK